MGTGTTFDEPCLKSWEFFEKPKQINPHETVQKLIKQTRTFKTATYNLNDSRIFRTLRTPRSGNISIR